MLILRHENDENFLFPLLSSKTYSVGRGLESQFIILEDVSVSRKHGNISVSSSGKVFIQDHSSTFGTYIFDSSKESKITPGKYFPLALNSELRFGLSSSVFRLEEHKGIRLSTSTLGIEEKSALQRLLKTSEVSEIIMEDWSFNTTHLIMNSFVLSVKASMALALGIPIVNTSFVEALMNSIKDGKAFPRISDFTPKLAESSLDPKEFSLLPNKNRHHIFKNKIFIFPSEKQAKKFKELVTLASGSIRIPDSTTINNNIEYTNMIVIKPSFVFRNPHYDQICQIFQEKHWSLIPESDIPLAILYSSSSMYCNPASMSLEKISNTQNIAEEKVFKNFNKTNDFENKFKDKIMMKNSKICEENGLRQKSLRNFPQKASLCVEKTHFSPKRKLCVTVEKSINGKKRRLDSEKEQKASCSEDEHENILSQNNNNHKTLVPSTYKEKIVSNGNILNQKKHFEKEQKDSCSEDDDDDLFSFSKSLSTSKQKISKNEHISNEKKHFLDSEKEKKNSCFIDEDDDLFSFSKSHQSLTLKQKISKNEHISNEKILIPDSEKEEKNSCFVDEDNNLFSFSKSPSTSKLKNTKNENISNQKKHFPDSEKKEKKIAYCSADEDDDLFSFSNTDSEKPLSLKRRISTNENISNQKKLFSHYESKEMSIISDNEEQDLFTSSTPQQKKIISSLTSKRKSIGNHEEICRDSEKEHLAPCFVDEDDEDDLFSFSSIQDVKIKRENNECLLKGSSISDEIQKSDFVPLKNKNENNTFCQVKNMYFKSQNVPVASHYMRSQLCDLLRKNICQTSKNSKNYKCFKSKNIKIPQRITSLLIPSMERLIVKDVDFEAKDIEVENYNKESEDFWSLSLSMKQPRK